MKKNRALNIMFLMVICTFLFMNNVHAADDFCTDEGVKRVMYMAYIVITACKIIVPIILVVMGTIDMARAVIAQDDGALKKQAMTFAKRCIAAILIFMAPGIINGIFNMVIDGYEESTNNPSEYKDCFTCLFNPNKCDVKRYGE